MKINKTISIATIICTVAYSSCLAQSNEKKILSFQEGPQNVPIDEANKKITWSVPPFVDLSKIKPTIKVSEGATISPASEVEQDFTKPVFYTVTAADGTTATYTAIATKGEGIPPGAGPRGAGSASGKMDMPQKPMGKISLTFDASKYETQTQEFLGKTVKVRAYEKIVYVANPADIAQEVMNIYIPEDYFNGGKINGYTAETAPIFFPNKVGGYMPSQPATFINSPQRNAGPGGPPSNAVVMALSKGYVVASAGARGRTSPVGKAPAGIVDLKAAVRYLKFNDKIMAGDAQKIISNGTSAGGAMSTLLGATGNHSDYEPYLKELGAAAATDDIFAVSAYCPITNLENADMAYEWQLNKIHSFNFRGKSGNLDADALKTSNMLKSSFPAYVNSLNLKDNKNKALTLDVKGEGSFKELLKTYLVASAQKALNGGADLSKHSFLKIKNGKVLSVDFDGYMIYLERMKTPPAFDALDNKSFENNLFGNNTSDNQHFTNFAFNHSKDESPKIAATQTIKMMNPMKYIGEKSANTAKYWRIRHGAKDRDTGFAIPMILAKMLENKGFKIDFTLPWDKPHSGDYDLEDLFDWIKSLK